MKGRKDAVNCPKIGMPDLMPENKHANQATQCTAEDGRQEQHLFGDTPAAANGFNLVNEVKHGHQ